MKQRKNIRLKSFNYSQTGSYFITICTYNKFQLFGEIIDTQSNTKMEMNNNGEIVKQAMEQLPNRFTNTKIDKYVIMPNHIHVIITLKREHQDTPLQQKRSEISKIVGYLKMNITKRIKETSKMIEKVWQRGYHDRIIRNELEYKKIWEYVDTNPLKWKMDKYCTEKQKTGALK
ncbi:MAG: transposase [Eubacteriales bacterium]